MAYAKWNPALETGDPTVDAQHRDIYQLVCEMHDAIERGSEPDFVEEALVRIMHYANNHFDSEEALMRRIGYPELDRHSALHRQFAADAHMMSKEYQQRREVVALALTSWLRQWLVNHIESEDRLIVAYMRSTPGQ